MASDTVDVDYIQLSLSRYAAGDDSALNELLSRTSSRMEKLTRAMFRDFARVHRWEETADVLQSASIRLYRALQANRPTDVRGFFALATLQIRRELTDLTRRYFGPEGLGTNYESGIANEASASSSCDPKSLIDWTEFHSQVEQLPTDDREVFDLIYYQGLSQDDAATVLGISLRTLQRRWQNARLVMRVTLDE